MPGVLFGASGWASSVCGALIKQFRLDPASSSTARYAAGRSVIGRLDGDVLRARLVDIGVKTDSFATLRTGLLVDG